MNIKLTLDKIETLIGDLKNSEKENRIHIYSTIKFILNELLKFVKDSD